MIKGKIIYPSSLGSFHFYDYFLEDGFQFIEPRQSDLLDLEQPMLLIPDFANLIAQVVQSSVCEPTHQRAENSAKDGRANQKAGSHLTWRSCGHVGPECCSSTRGNDVWRLLRLPWRLLASLSISSKRYVFCWQKCRRA
jgi:hypothetical protein